MKPLAITGLGAVSGLGVGREAHAAAIAAQRGGASFTKATVLDAGRVGDAYVAEVTGWDPKPHLGDKGLRNLDRLTTFLIVAARRALEDAGLKRDGAHVGPGAARIGICSSTAYGSLDAITELNLVAELEDPRYINPARFPNTVINAAAGYVSIWEDLKAPNITVVDGNCGGLDVVLSAATALANRRGDAFLVGGGEVISEPLYVAFQKLGAVAEGPGGGGLHFGEGAAYLVMERAEDARARGARVLGEVLGYANVFGAPESEALLTATSSATVARALRAALRDAGVEASAVDAVVGSECGLPVIDDAERAAVEELFGAAMPRVVPKRVFGETFGAAGALGMLTAVLGFGGVDLSGLSDRAPRPLRTVVVLAVGYYGNVSAAVLRAPTA